MASAWGKAWGAAFGAAWGVVTAITPPAPAVDAGFNPPISHDRSHKPAPLTRRHLRRKRQQDILFLGR